MAAPFISAEARPGAADYALQQELVRLYEPEVRRIIRTRLTDLHLRPLLDSQDICQSVLGNFFVRAATGQFELDTPQQLLNADVQSFAHIAAE